MTRSKLQMESFATIDAPKKNNPRIEEETMVTLASQGWIFIYSRVDVDEPHAGGHNFSVEKREYTFCPGTCPMFHVFHQTSYYEALNAATLKAATVQDKLWQVATLNKAIKELSR